jgi:hypothetical protein
MDATEVEHPERAEHRFPREAAGAVRGHLVTSYQEVPAYRAVDNHVYDRVRHFLVRRHKVPSHGTRRFPREAVFGALGVVHLRRVHLGPPPCASR